MNNRFEEQSIENSSPNEVDKASNPVASLIGQSVIYNSEELKDETAALETAKTAVIERLTDPNAEESELRNAWIAYTEIAERIVDSVENTSENPKVHAKSQVEAIIHKALIFQAAGNTLRYLEELDSAEVYAYNEVYDTTTTIINNELVTEVTARDEDFEKISTALDNEIAATIETLDVSQRVLIIKLRGVISKVHREELRDLIDEGDDFEGTLSRAYDMILDEGGVPDVILREMGIEKF